MGSGGDPVGFLARLLRNREFRIRHISFNVLRYQRAGESVDLPYESLLSPPRLAIELPRADELALSPETLEADLTRYLRRRGLGVEFRRRHGSVLYDGL